MKLNSSRNSMLEVIFISIIAGASAQTPFKLSVSKEAQIELTCPSELNFDYRIESTENLGANSWQVVAKDLPGTGSTLSVSDPSATGTRRFYRAVKVAHPIPQISTNAIWPNVNVLYPEKTILGSALLGLQFTIPSEWKGGLPEGTSVMVFGSDTETGSAVALITLAGDLNYTAARFGKDFPAGSRGAFQVSQSPQISGNLVTFEWSGTGFNDEGYSLEGVTLRLIGVAHPSGGIVGYGGFFVASNRSVVERVLQDFINSTVMAPRKTRGDLIDLIAGKQFVWAKTSSTGSGGDTGSLQSWSQNNAFFCLGTYEITTHSESTYGGNLGDGGFYSGGSSSDSTDVGDWTILDTDVGPVMVLLSPNGAQGALFNITGNSVIFGEQQFDYSGPHNCN